MNVDWIFIKDVFFKLLAISFALGYLIYGLIYLQQIRNFHKNTFLYHDQLGSTQAENKTLLFSLGILQIFIGILLLLFALFAL